MSTEPLVVGAVAYTPNVVPIWEGIRGYFQDSESPDTQMDFVLYSNYARLVDSLIAGHIDIAWNTNLAYVRTVLQTGGRCTPLAQRDTDVDYTTVFVAHAGSDLHGAKDIAGKRLALGSADSAHAAILPLYYLRRAGIAESDLQVIRFDTDIGKHGDTGRSELDAVDAVLTHDPKFDVPVLEVALRLGVGYVGAMGSRKTHDDRMDRLRAAGLTDAELSRLSSPIGLDLGARTPEETAVSIAADIIARRWGGGGRPLADIAGRIHHDAQVAGEFKDYLTRH